MRCPSCGALKSSHSEHCVDVENLPPEKEVTQPKSPNRPRKSRKTAGPSGRSRKIARENSQPESRLIAFPVASQATMPVWRKELSERVREARERRAREAAAEAEKNGDATIPVIEQSPKAEGAVPQLELLSRQRTVSTNPLVEKALRRIDRAYQVQPASSREQPLAKAVAASAISNQQPQRQSVNQPENLNVSPSMTALEPAKLLEPEAVSTTRGVELVSVNEELARQQTAPALEVVEAKKEARSNGNPRRLIGEDPHDPALNYLDSVRPAVKAHRSGHIAATATQRVMAALVDLGIVLFLASPIIAAVELLYGDWDSNAALAIAAGGFLTVIFLYETISTALSGTTLGKRLLDLRVIDTRTGLIPTGSQAASRALVYAASFLTLGSGILYALVDRDHRPAHDRLSRTAVIRAGKS